jgi:hypothetical protein
MQVHLTLMFVVINIVITSSVRPFNNEAQQERLLHNLEMSSLMAIFLTLWAASVFSTYPKCEDPNAAGQTIAWCDVLSVLVGLVDFIILISLMGCFVAVKFFGVAFGTVFINNTGVGKSLSRWASMRSFRKEQKKNVQSTSATAEEKKTTADVAAAQIELTSIRSKDVENNDSEKEEGWVTTVDPSTGRSYMYNKQSGETKWVVDKEKKELKTSVNPLMASKKNEENKGDDWDCLYDEINQANYWVNKKTGESKWA